MISKIFIAKIFSKKNRKKFLLSYLRAQEKQHKILTTKLKKDNKQLTNKLIAKFKKENEQLTNELIAKFKKENEQLTNKFEQLTTKLTKENEQLIKVNEQLTNKLKEKNEEKCSICLSNLKNHNCITTKCNHTYHMNCYNTWRNNHDNCPLCRRNNLPKIDTANLEIKIKKYRINENNYLRIIRDKQEEIEKLENSNNSNRLEKAYLHIINSHSITKRRLFIFDEINKGCKTRKDLVNVIGYSNTTIVNDIDSTSELYRQYRGSGRGRPYTYSSIY